MSTTVWRVRIDSTLNPIEYRRSLEIFPSQRRLPAQKLCLLPQWHNFQHTRASTARHPRKKPLEWRISLRNCRTKFISR